MSSAASALPAPEPADVLVAVVPAGVDAAADHRMLAALAAPLATASVSPDAADAADADAAADARANAAPAPALTVTHHCPACGSTDHGRPLLLSAGEPVRAVQLSLSRAAGWVALAATLAGPVGVDIESLAAVRTAAFDDVAFDDEERAALRAQAEAHGPAAADRMRALAWAAKEAVLKAAGTGLRTDPRLMRLNLDGTDGQGRVRLHGDAPGLTLLSLSGLASGLVGAVAVLSANPVRIRSATLPPNTGADGPLPDDSG
ncbi:4'-phosphopantetheinyl transferase superfamily protein [Herbiconiux sp. P17]|uniref:4'-phosphopantetheinyl transferase family protein n=1 Tax=Herbiconiux wuyangfengii TaxID=3342794 RepID=UPI0035B7AC00